MTLQIKAKILFEDNYLIVFDKPSGMVVNISETSPENTLQNTLHIIDSDDSDSEFSTRSGILHRLDKDTSGVIIVAKDNSTFAHIKNQFISRTVKKHYVAVCIGHAFEENFVIRAPIKRDPHRRLRMCVHPDGKHAVTQAILRKNFIMGNYSFCLLDIYPLTGRTHQIRVHLSALNLPIVGDRIYLTKKQLTQSELFTNRLMLHSLDLTIVHPASLESMTFTAPLPDEFEKMYSKCL